MNTARKWIAIPLTALVLTAGSLNAAQQEAGGKGLQGEETGGSPGQLLQLKDSLLNLIQMDKTYSLDIQLTLDDTQAQITGTIAQPWQFKGLDLHLSLQGPDPARLSSMLGFPLPSLPAYKVKTQLTREDDAWKFKEFQGTLGDSHLAGAITLQDLDERPLIKADITSRQLNLDDLASLWAMPQAEPALPGKGPVIPKPLQAIDAEISFQGQRIRTPQFTLNHVSANLELKKGQLTIEPLTLDAGGGKVRASMALDTTIQPVRGHMKIDLDNIDLEQALQPLEVTAAGTVHALLSFFLVGETLIVEDSQITYRNPDDNTDITALINTELATQGADSEVNIKGSGKLHGEPFYLNLTGGPLFDLLEPDQPFPLTADIKAGDTHAEIEGTLTQPFKPKGMDIDLLMEGPDPARLFPILGLALPSLPPYRVEGRLSWKGYTWKFQDFQGLVGDSDLSGDITVETGSERPLMEAQLVSDRLDFDDLAGLVGAAPRAGPGETVSPPQKREAIAEARDEFVLPAEPLELRRLKTMDARVNFRGKRVHAPALPLDDVVMKVELEDGRLVFKPLNFVIGQGNVRSRIQIDRSTLPVRDSLEAEVQRVNLREILKSFDIADDSVGIIGGRVRLQGTGASVAGFLGSANGELALIMTDGKLDSLLVELAGLDAGEALITALGDTQSVDIGCALADLQVKDGIATVKSLVIDTSDTRITGQGSIDLKRERFELVLEPHPKEPSLLAASSPLHVEGRFEEPTAYPDTTELIARGAAAVALGAVATPFAALIPLIELGLGEDGGRCQELIDRLKRQ